MRLTGSGDKGDKVAREIEFKPTKDMDAACGCSPRITWLISGALRGAIDGRSA